jgi:putative transposase
MVCNHLGFSSRTFHRWVKNPDGDRRRGPISAPANKLTTKEHRSILDICNSSQYRDLPPSQIVPKLADLGLYLGSESSFYRVLKSQGMAQHRLRSKPRQIIRPSSLIATAPGQVWTWDITYLKSDVAGKFFYLYMVLDIYSRKIVGFEVKSEQSGEYASALISRLCQQEHIAPNQLRLHSDNGTPMKSANMLATLQRLGVVPSFSRPAVSDDNPFSEATFRTLKYHRKFPGKPFTSPEDAQQWVADFCSWYNNEHMHSGIKFVTPSSRHNGDDGAILQNRKKVYELARKNQPNRWRAKVRNWNKEAEVYLN